MSKKKNLFKSSVYKNIFIYHLFISLIIFISNLYRVYNELALSPYPVCLQLHNNNVFIINKDGMFLCDLNLNIFQSHVFYYQEITNFEDVMSKIIIVQYEEKYGGNIICLISKNIYFFQENGILISTAKLPDNALESSYINLLAYKKEGDFFYFFICFMDMTIKQMTINLYAVKNENYYLVSTFNYKPFYLDYTAIAINNKIFTCQILNSNKIENVLSCCYKSIMNDLIVVQSFDIDNNLSEIEEYYSKIPIDNINMMISTISEDKKNMIVCYSPTNQYGYCFNYNFETNQITNNKPYIEKCINKQSLFKLNYFPQKEEYVLICQSNNNLFTVIKFNKCLKLINLDEITVNNFQISDCSGFNSISLIYDINSQNYAIISDNDNLSTKKYPITTDFTKHFASQFEKPEEFIEPPITRLGDLCIEESNKYYVYTENKIVFANSVENKRIIIDFINENDLFVKTKQNKTINPFIYSFQISLSNKAGELKINIDGEEKKIFGQVRIPNITQLIFYPLFDDDNSNNLFTFTYSLYLKNNTLASKSANFVVNICKTNCSCDSDNSFCKDCLDNYFPYIYKGNCALKEDLSHTFYDMYQNLYIECHRMCKTCSQAPYSDDEMFCLTCYTEHGDYKEGNNCIEKFCENLFYRDKDTGMKTCIEESSCPENYPILKGKECRIMKIENSSSSGIINSDTKINNTYQSILDSLKESISEEELNQINKTYSALSNIIQNQNFSSFNEELTINGKNITYQITTSEMQKNANHNSNVSVIDLGECEKIIKRNISYEDDKTPLIILKIDIRKSNIKSTAVEYEVYNPYTYERINLSICSNISIAVYAPVNLTEQESFLYDDLNGQGYDLFDGNNSFYRDLCTPYTSENGTDVTLADRKDYYYNEDIVLCENSCEYYGVNTSSEKAFCQCKIKEFVNVNNSQEFNPQLLLENFYKLDTITNFEVLFCYKLVFSSKGLKKNICFYIILVLFILFLGSMIGNLFSALKKIDEIIFKIFQDRFMYYFMQKIIISGRKKRNEKTKGESANDKNNKKEGEANPKLGWLAKLKLAKQKKANDNQNEKEKEKVKEDSIFIFNKSLNEVSKKNLTKIKKKKKNKKQLLNEEKDKISEFKEEEENNKKIDSLFLRNSLGNINNLEMKSKIMKNIINDEKDNINQNDKYHSTKKQKENYKSPENNYNYSGKNLPNFKIRKNLMNQYQPPKKNGIARNETNIEEKMQQKDYDLKSTRKKKNKKNKKKININDSNCSNSLNNLKKIDSGKNKSKNFINSLNEQKGQEIKKKIENKKEEENQLKQKKSTNNNNNIKYIDEELNRMDYKNALINDQRNYMQYYWSLLKKKHMIILTFISKDDFNVFLLKISLFILSLALFFSINTLFFKDATMHVIFEQQGKYSLIYQIPQILYSTLISFVMTFFLKKLSLSQNEIITIKKEHDTPKAKKLAAKTKDYFRIKIYSFFSVGIALLIFFWYYISAFAAVYQNTQIHLIKDTLLSFGLSMLYPIIYNFAPGIFRFWALKSHKRNKKCLYRASQMIALF